MSVIYRIALIVVWVLLLTACDPTGFYFGRAVPNARIEVTLDAPLPPDEIHRIFSELTAANGYPYLYGGPEDPEGQPRRYYSWIERGEMTRRTVTGVSIFWDDQPDFVQVFIFEYTAAFKAHSFDAKDWMTFECWRNTLIPEALPGAHIKILEHPAEHTNSELVQSISESTGIEVPDEIAEKMERRLRERGVTN